MIGLELGEERAYLVEVKKKKIVKVVEGSDVLFEYRKKPKNIVFCARKVVGKLFPEKVGEELLNESFEEEFVVRRKVFKKDGGKYTFLAGIPVNELRVIEALLEEEKVKRLDFPPFVLYDLLYTTGVVEARKEFVAFHRAGDIIYYLLVKDTLPVFASSFPAGSDEEGEFSEFFKIFFEEGAPPVYLSGDFDESYKMFFKELTMDGEVELVNPFKDFEMETKIPEQPHRFTLALGVGL